MSIKRVYFAKGETNRFINHWDILLLLLIFCLIFFFGFAGSQMAVPYKIGTPLSISLDPAYLPFYALRTILRMFIALGFSLIVTLIMGYMAAKNRRAEQIIIPAIDILQSVPVLSFLSITITGFIHLFPNSLLGPECACIFAIFTAQVWNIIFGFYQSLKALPNDLKEAALMFHLSGWQRFWKVELPSAMPSLLWNMMMSMSASWFFVVVSEAISVAHQNIRLPGLGSYIAVAIEQRDLLAIGYSMLMMIIVIFLYDQLFFRPLITWSQKFSLDLAPENEEYQSWLVDFFRNSILMKRFAVISNFFTDKFINNRLFMQKPHRLRKEAMVKSKPKEWLVQSLIFTTIGLLTYLLLHFILQSLNLRDILNVVYLGAITGFRVLILIILSLLLWVPIGVFIGLRPGFAQKIQPIIQFVAAFPANLFYPLFVIAIVQFHLSTEIWLTPLMILGTQWYILFNVIAGASQIPRELYLAAENMGLKGWLWWKRLSLPAIFPFCVTGAITAAGGAWNASIVAEYVSWGSTSLAATGLGSYIQVATLEGNFPKIALGTAMMCAYVLAFNHLLWRPLYKLAEERYRFN